MAVKTRKFASTTVDENGNLHANGVGLSTGPGRSADDVRYDSAKNIASGVTGKVGSALGSAGLASNAVNKVKSALSGAATAAKGTSVNSPSPLAGSASPTSTNRTSASYKSMLQDYEDRGLPTYDMSDRVLDYQDRLADIEDQEKPTWQSKYEPTIQNILDGILNRKAFDINTDNNYKTLYDQYAQSYMLQGNRAMRDQLGASAGLTGGYGSTAAQAAAQQAYDNYLEGLNDRNVQLMNLAYGIYQDETADRYNQLGAVTNLDNTDYSRYRDDVNDFYNERDYWANRYQQEYANDYGQYRDDVSDYMNDRDYYANRYATEYGFETEEDNTKYNRYQDAVNMAMQYASKGLPVPDYIAKQIMDYTGAADISDVVAAMPVTTGGSGGGGGGRGRSGSSKSSKKDQVYQKGGWMPYADELSKSQNYENDVISKAEKMSSPYDKYRYIAGLAETNKLTWVQAYTLLKRLGVDADYFANFEENMATEPEKTKQSLVNQSNDKLKKSTFLKSNSLKW